MNRITALLLLMLTGQSTSEHLHTLSCPYENKNVTASNFRVWCKRDAQDENCCTGFSFKRDHTDLDGGKIKVVDNGKSFTISVQELTQGDGVYWCGIMMTEDKVIFKLAEDYFTNNPMNFLWSILRWIIFVLLSVMTISVHIYSNNRGKTERGRRHINTE